MVKIVMIEVINPEFFTINKHAVNTDIDTLAVLYNVMAQPQRFDLPAAKRLPFASIIMSHMDASLLELNSENNNTELYDILKTYDLESHSLYDDDNEYGNYTSYFTEGWVDGKVVTLPIHTKLYTIDIKNPIVKHSTQQIVIIAIPLKGILAPIKKSNDYTLYNASFVSCKPFFWKDGYYNKLVYLMVDISTTFSFQEYILVKGYDNIQGYYTMLNHIFYFNGKNIEEYVIQSIVPYEGREHFFAPNPSKNLFSLSDIPEDIIVKSNSISVKFPVIDHDK